MEVLESRNVTKSFVPKLDVMSDQDDSQTDEEHSSKVDIYTQTKCACIKLRAYPKFANSL